MPTTTPDDARPPLCFVIMPFHEPFEEYYLKIMQPAAHKAGFTVQRANDIMGPGAFMQDVATGLRDAAVVVAELTGRNANVFYELGLAHAWGKPVIMLTQRKEDVPSDLLSLKWILYSTISPTWAAKLMRDLVSALKAVGKGDRKTLMFPFVHPALNGAAADLRGKLIHISGTQKQLLDYIRDARQPVDQRTVGARFTALPAAELFYRLECLRLHGFLSCSETGGVAGKGVYSYELSPEARALTG